MTTSTEDPHVLAARLMQRANLREGLPEIASGLFLLAASGWIYATAIGALGPRSSVIVLLLGSLVFGLGTRPLLNWLRRRYLIEQLGYVQFKPMERRYLVISTLLAVAVVVAIWLLHGALPLRWVPAMAGLFWGSYQVWLGRLVELPRLVYAGAAIAVAGVLLAWLGPGLRVSMAMLIGIGGAFSVISGAVALARALR